MGGIVEDVRIARHAVWRWRWIVLAAAWAICLAGWLAVTQVPDHYQSVSRTRFDAGQRTRQSVAVPDDQLGELQAKLTAAEAKRGTVRSRDPIAPPAAKSPEDRVAVARQLIAQIDQDLIQANALLQSAKAQVATAPAPAAAGAVGPAHAWLGLIAQQIDDARDRGFTATHPDMVVLQAQYRQAQAAADNEPAAAAGEVSDPSDVAARALVSERQAAVQALQARKAAIAGAVDRIPPPMSAHPAAAAAPDQAERDYRAMKDQYDRLLSSRQRVALRGDAPIRANPAGPVVTAPSAASIGPNRPLLLTAVLFAGICGGIALAFGLAQVKTTYPTAERLEKAVGLPVIGAIGEVVTTAQRELRRRRLRLFAGGAGALAVAYGALLGIEFLHRGLTA